MNTNFKKNIKKGFSKDSLWNDLGSAIAGFIYVFLPSILKMDGWLGVGVGAGLTYALGKLLDWPGLAAGAVTNVVTHCTYVYGRGIINSINGGNGVFVLDTETYRPGSNTPVPAYSDASIPPTTQKGIGSFMTLDDGTVVERMDGVNGVAGFMNAEESQGVFGLAELEGGNFMANWMPHAA